jgi:hypothetical protein
MALEYINILQSKALKNLPNFGIFGLKTNHLATLVLGAKILVRVFAKITRPALRNVGNPSKNPTSAFQLRHLHDQDDQGPVL